MFRFAAIVFIAVCPLAVCDAETRVPPASGTSIQNFSLKDIHRRPRSLDSYKDKKAVVVVFVGTECPLANLYYPTLVDLHRDLRRPGRANPGDQLQQSRHVPDRLCACPGAGPGVPRAQGL